MRIVLATFGSLGDLHPVIALGRALQARGHHAAILTSEYHRNRVAAAGLEFHPAAPDLRPDDEASSGHDGRTARDRRKSSAS